MKIKVSEQAQRAGTRSKTKKERQVKAQKLCWTRTTWEHGQAQDQQCSVVTTAPCARFRVLCPSGLGQARLDSAWALGYFSGPRSSPKLLVGPSLMPTMVSKGEDTSFQRKEGGQGPPIFMSLEKGRKNMKHSQRVLRRFWVLFYVWTFSSSHLTILPNNMTSDIGQR